MNLNELKKEAVKNKFGDVASLSEKVAELKQSGLSFLGCIAFVQANQNLSLDKAKELTLQLEAYSKEEKKNIEQSINLMLSEFKEE